MDIKDIKKIEFELFFDEFSDEDDKDLEIYTIQDIIDGERTLEEGLPLLNALAKEDPNSKIFDIIFKEHPEIMKDIDFEQADNQGNTLINIVCETNYDVSIALIDSGVDLNCGQDSPLQKAIYYPDLEKSKILVKKLLENGANPLYKGQKIGSYKLSPIFDLLNKDSALIEIYFDYVDVNSPSFKEEEGCLISLLGKENLNSLFDQIKKQQSKIDKIELNQKIQLRNRKSNKFL